MDDIRDIAMHKDVARLKTQDRSLRAARVGASDPEDLGLLAVAERGEFLGVGRGPVGFIEFEAGLEFVCCLRSGGREMVSLVFSLVVVLFYERVTGVGVVVMTGTALVMDMSRNSKGRDIAFSKDRAQ